MTILLFLAVLVVLILVHEFGHFIVAKWSGMRVDEFGIGFPPKIWSTRVGETEYSVNALPFGGFVRIYGEDDVDGEVATPDPRAFTSRPKNLQAATLVAGVAMNWLLAFLIIAGLLVAGTPRALSPEEVAIADDARLVVAQVMPDSPSAEAGLQTGDTVVRIESASGEAFSSADAEEFSAFVSSRIAGEPLTITVNRDGEELVLTTAPATGIIASDPERAALGVSVGSVGTIPTPLLKAPIEAAKLTWSLTEQTASGLGTFLWNAITLNADFSQVAGPVGIAGAVGDAYEDSVAQLLFLAAIISINLAIINLLPVPALDGGRLLFVAYEAISRRRIPSGFAATVNSIGFILLILLMVAVTVSDVVKLL